MSLRRCLLATLVGASLALVPAIAPQAADPGSAAAAAQVAPAGQPVPGAERMAAHRAAYRLTLDQVRANSGISSAEGVMLYEVGDACEGWTTRQRFTLRLTDRDGQVVETTSDYSTYETKDGRNLRFSLTQSSGGAVAQRIAGEATVTPEGGVVRYTNPEEKEVRLPAGTLLPTVHTIHALDEARAGHKLLVVPLFDGTSAEGAQDTTAVLSAWTQPQPNQRFPALGNLGSARMRIAFFDRGSTRDGSASAPDYEVGLRYFDNGVADDLNMDFGEFVVNGKLEELALLPGGC
jgi:EipB-like